jgi:nitroreductase
MTVREAIETRKSVRSWKDRPVPDDVLQRVMDAARVAPSARNQQEWRFVVVRDAELRARLSEAAGGDRFIAEAPVVLVACAETDGRRMRCGHPAFLVDVSIALDHIALAAVEEGLGTCWIGGFDVDAVRSAVGIPNDIEVVELMPLGYPADPHPAKKRRLSLEQIVRFERW